MAGNDLLLGGDGDDSLYGGDSRTPLCTGDGDDRLYMVEMATTGSMVEWRRLAREADMVATASWWRWLNDTSNGVRE